ncbi:MAG TPA: DNA primase [Candidatus Limnocylindria bacterium]
MSSAGSVAEIKSRLPVAEIVGETVQLKRAGSTMKGLCPFHTEKTPSFTVSPERESWHCFGCGEHGDIFTFVMKRDGIDFREALNRLAERAGVELSAAGAKEDRRRKRLRDALEAAIAWYREVLRQASVAEPARQYLAERGFTEETLDQFGIGFAPDNWEALVKRLAARGFTTEEMVAAGLASVGQRGKPVDRFRGRIMIPIRDASGKPTGLGGRVMPGGEGPKYLNSPATALFDKSRTLYGIDLARQAIRREKLAVIVEGYTDVMAAHQAGFTNVVASMGTALTGGQVDIVTRYADAITLAYDVDLAGEAATERGLLEELGPSQAITKLRVIRIPSGKDPAELLQTDPDAWRQAIEDAKPLMDYFMEREAARVDMSTVAGRREMAGRVLAKLQRITDSVVQDMYLQELSQIVKVDERILREGLERPRVQRRAATSPTAATAVGPGAIVLDPVETETLALLFRQPGLTAEHTNNPLPFGRPVATALADAWTAWVAQHASNGSTNLEGFLAELDPISSELARAVIQAASAGPKLDPPVAAEALRVCRLRLRRARIEEAIGDGRHMLEDAERDGDRELLAQIETHITQLGREKAEVTRLLATPAVSAHGGS